MYIDNIIIYMNQLNWCNIHTPYAHNADIIHYILVCYAVDYIHRHLTTYIVTNMIVNNKRY